jgi:hypothetical protein
VDERAARLKHDSMSDRPFRPGRADPAGSVRGLQW